MFKVKKLNIKIIIKSQSQSLYSLEPNYSGLFYSASNSKKK